MPKVRRRAAIRQIVALPSVRDITAALQLVQDGDSDAVNRLSELVYPELRALAGSYMRKESAGHTMQPTELVHEAFIKLVDQRDVDWRGRSHFFAVSAQAMRRLLVDHARRKKSRKRGGDVVKVSLEGGAPLTLRNDADVLAVDDALGKLSEVNERHAKVVELRFFGGLKVHEVAEVLGGAARTVESDWTFARAWLRRELAPSDV